MSGIIELGKSGNARNTHLVIADTDEPPNAWENAFGDFGLWYQLN